MSEIHQDEHVYTRRFFSSEEMYDMFQRYYERIANKYDITHKGVMTSINNIIRDGNYPHLKRHEKNTREKKQSDYIFLD